MKSSKRGRTEPFIAMDVLKAARAAEAAGRDVIHLELGQPAAPAPAAARAALARALSAGEPMGYTVGVGLPSLRARIAGLYAERYGLEIDPARIVVTNGSSAGFILAFTAFLEAGDRVAVADPSYPSYRNTLSALGLDLVRVETGPETRYQPTPELLGEAEGLLIASPANPTGTMLDHGAMAALAAHCAERDMVLISDEIYHGLDFGARAVSALEVTDEAVVINSFSKYHCMTGWRIGWMVVPEAMVRTVEMLAANLFICAPHPSQIAAEAALDAGEELDGHLEVYRRNRALLLEGLPRLGITEIAPCDGAFYIYAGIGHLTEDSVAFCRDLLDRHGLAITPGVDFDPVRGHRTMRLCFAGSTPEIEAALERLGNAVG